MTEQRLVFVHSLPALIPSGALHGGTVVVVDVLRATTMMVSALAAGCEAVVPCAEIDEAREIAARFPSGQALLGGERHGLPIEGFDVGNSPDACTPEVCRGKTLVMTTTNGTRAILASLEAERVLIAAFVNMAATLRAIEGDSSPIHIVCSGTEGEISFEDSLLAGALVSHLNRAGARAANDSAHIVSALWQTTEECGGPLSESLTLGRGGQRVLQIGLKADIEAASSVDRFDLVAELVPGPEPESTAELWQRSLRIVART